MRALSRKFQRWLVLGVILNCVALLGVPDAAAASNAKTKITRQTDLPRTSYAIAGTASQFVEADDAQFNPFAAKVRADIERILADYEIEDKSTMRKLLARQSSTCRNSTATTGPVCRPWRHCARWRKNLRSKLTSGLFARARLQAALDTRRRPAALRTSRRFASTMPQSIDPLPWDVVQDADQVVVCHSRASTRRAADAGRRQDRARSRGSSSRGASTISRPGR